MPAAKRKKTKAPPRKSVAQTPAKKTAPKFPRLFRHTRGTQMSLRNNKAHQFAAAQALSIYRANAIYTFIPKNACSTLRFTLALANGCVSGEEDVNWIHHNNNTFSASLTELVKADYTFVVLRDPFRRIASAFLDKFAAKDVEAWRFFAATNRSVDLDTLTFHDFVMMLHTVLQADIHWRPQSDFLVYENYDDWFCVEDFGAAVKTLKKRIGLAVADSRDLIKHGSDQFRRTGKNLSLGHAPAYELARYKRAGMIPQPANLYDKETIAEVRKLYAADFALYDRVIGRRVLYP